MSYRRLLTSQKDFESLKEECPHCGERVVMLCLKMECAEARMYGRLPEASRFRKAVREAGGAKVPYEEITYEEFGRKLDEEVR